MRAGWPGGRPTRKGGELVKPIGAGAGGGLLGGYTIVLLLKLFATLAPLAGAALGAMAALTFVAQRKAQKT